MQNNIFLCDYIKKIYNKLSMKGAGTLTGRSGGKGGKSRKIT